jgi:hypothetical protein
MRVFARPVREQHDVISDGPGRGVPGIDNESAVDADLLLHGGVGVVPIGAALADGELIRESCTRCDWGEADQRDAVHARGHQQAVPVYGSLLRHPVADVDAGGVTLSESQRGTGDATVDGQSNGSAARDDDLPAFYSELVFPDRGVNRRYGDECKQRQERDRRGYSSI